MAGSKREKRRGSVRMRLKTFLVRLTAAEFEVVRKAAAAAYLPLTVWARQQLLLHAEAMLARPIAKPKTKPKTKPKAKRPARARARSNGSGAHLAM
jgi:hypothetical protein